MEPENALLTQYQNLLATEGIALHFETSAIAEIAKVAYEVNCSAEDIGARRLHTILERVMDEISFDPQALGSDNISIDAQYVRSRLGDILQDDDLSRYIL